MNTKQILTIIIPVYNEAKFIEELYSRVISVKLPSNLSKEVIIIDDGSKDRTKEIILHIYFLSLLNIVFIVNI